MEQRVAEVLQKNFKGAQVHLDRDPLTERISGRLLWDGFAGHDFLWRQNALFRVLRRELGPEAQVVSHIFTYTPNESEQMIAA